MQWTVYFIVTTCNVILTKKYVQLSVIGPFRPQEISMTLHQSESTKGPLELLVWMPQGLLFRGTCRTRKNFRIFQHQFYTWSLSRDSDMF